MSARALLLWTCAACMLAVAAPTRSRAADVIVDVSAAYITREIDQAITEYIARNLPTFDWLENVTHVEVSASRVDRTTVGFRLNLRFQATVGSTTVEIPILLEADVSLHCNGDGPFAAISGLRVFPQVPAAEPVLEQLRAEANRMLAEQSRSISDRLMRLLGELPSYADIHEICPRFAVADDGAIRAELDFANGCINGQERVRSCGRQHGNGARYVCRNGWWQLLSIDCPPPGGEPQ